MYDDDDEIYRYDEYDVSANRPSEHADEDDKWGFWQQDQPTRALRRTAIDEPTRSLRRVEPGRRAHDRVDRTEFIPVVRTSSNASPRPQISPRVLRLGALVAAAAVMVPVAMSLGSDSGSVSSTAPATTTALVSALPPTVGAVATSLVVLAAPTDIVVVPSTAVAPVLPATQPAVQAQPLAEALPASAPVPAAGAQPQVVEKSACAKKYTIVAGDYWILIAKKVSVTYKELLAANGATTKTALYAGKTICLPKNASKPKQVVAPTTTVPAPVSTTAAEAPAAKPTQAAPATTLPVAIPKTTTPAPKTTTPSPTTPPTTPKPAPTTTAPAPKNNYSRAEVEQIIRDVWPDDLEDEAVRIATRESDLTPTVRNYCCYGLFQIYYSQHSGWLNAMGVTDASGLFDPRTNALAALVLFQRAGGWGPWKL